MILDELAIKYGTDKSSQHHDYCKVYEHYFEPLRDNIFDLLEIGIGGYQYEDRGGESLRMWNEYFTAALITGVDIFEKNLSIGERVLIFCEKDIEKIAANLRPLIITDDGSHINSETIHNFKTCFPYLQSGGLYFIEDCHTSYWELNFYGNEVPGAEGTTMRFFTDLTHQLNHNTLLPEYRNEYAGQIEFIHFYKQLIVVKKA